MLLAVVFLGCSKRFDPPPAPKQEGKGVPPTVLHDTPPPSQRPLSALLDVQAEKEALVVAVVDGSRWQAPSIAGKEAVERLAKRGTAYHLFPAGGTRAGTGTASGTLEGTARQDCGDFQVALAAPTTAQGFAAVNTAHPTNAVAAVPLESAKIEKRDIDAVAAVIEHAAKIKVAPTIEHAYRVDLDGSGKAETILQATHPDLLGDPPKYKRQYYSLVVVLSDETREPAFTGYMQAASDRAHFEVLTVDSVADVDSDGQRELLIRARHAEGWQTQIFRYDGKALKELFRSTTGEGQCAGGTGGVGE